MTSRVAGTAALALGTAALVSACASSSTSNNAPSTSTSSTTVSTSPSTSSASAATSTSSAPSSPSVSSSPSSSTSSAPPAGPASCTFAQLGITLVRGGSSPHTQLAGLIFTNRSAKTCGLRGYPHAQLILHNGNLGSPAHNAPGASDLVTLHAGQSAESDLTATTTCNAPLSDHVRVSAPGEKATVDLAITMRGCVLSVAPVVPAS